MRIFLTIALVHLAACYTYKPDSGATDLDEDGYDASVDCDDDDAEVHPDADELCDQVDNDCDGEVDESDAADAPSWYRDSDGDSYGDASSHELACVQPEGFVDNDEDCDDGDAEIRPEASEICDDVDNDCDGLVDDDDPDLSGAPSWYLDYDDDGYGGSAYSEEACQAPSGYTDTDTDCDDTDAAINPAATEVCDELDNDCDELVDDEDDSLDASTASSWYADGDGDGYGDETSASTTCEQPKDHVADATDCDDADASVNPAAPEICDELDNDCDELVDDEDPGVTGLPTWYIDFDSDGYGGTAYSTEACAAPTGYVADATDCDDTDAGVNPAASEVCDGLDNDCDDLVDDEDDSLDGSTTSSWYADADADGYGDASSASAACAQPTGHVEDDADCDDSDDGINPAASEVCDELDNDCDGQTDDEDASLDTSTTSGWYEDADADGYGVSSSSTVACAQPSGHAADSDDCDDADATINPGADELCNGVDDDCDGTTDEDDAIDAATWYEDADTDGYGSSTVSQSACEAPTGWVADGSDCDDTTAAVNPDIWEDASNGIDDDCDGDTDEDLTLTGSVEYYTESDGVVICDATFDLVGTPYTGTCEDCEFSFSIASTQSRDDGTSDCDPYFYYSFVDEGPYTNLVLAYRSTDAYYYNFYHYYYYVAASDSLLSGYSYDGSYYGWGYYPGPYFRTLWTTGSSTSSFSLAGRELYWSIYVADYDYLTNYDDDCATGDYLDAYLYSASGSYSGVSTLGCPADVGWDSYIDVWTLDVTSGDHLEITVGTISDSTAFDPFFWINDPSGCWVGMADDSFTCTYEPADYACPAGTIDPTAQTGTYQVVVGSYGSCNGTTAVYEIRVDASTDPSLTLLHDDADTYTTVLEILSVTGSATVE